MHDFDAIQFDVILVDGRTTGNESLTAALGASGARVAARFSSREKLQPAIRELQPDIVVIALEAPDREVFDDLRRISREQPRPIAMFVDRSDRDSIRAAVQAGIGAYVVNGASPERMRAVLELAVERFGEFQSLREELARARNSLEDRVLIDRAKGILMDRRSVSEPEAYRSLRSMAMSRNMRLVDIARNVIDMAELL